MLHEISFEVDDESVIDDDDDEVALRFSTVQ